MGHEVPRQTAASPRLPRRRNRTSHKSGWPRPTLCAPSRAVPGCRRASALRICGICRSPAG
eukprot:10575107-Alexandrium_andersonii.AAC.1